MKHDFQVMSSKTARASGEKKGQKYLGKNGEQGYRVVTLINNVWYAKMIYDEALIPIKGKEYEIELTEEGDWKNWDYKLLSKEEQVMEQSEPTFSTDAGDVTVERSKEPPKEINLAGRGASWNNAFMWCLRQQPDMPLKDFLAYVYETAETIAPDQEKFVNKT